MNKNENVTTQVGTGQGSNHEGKEVDLGDVKKYPQNETKQGEIRDIEVTTKGQYFNEKGAELKYGDPQDRIIVIQYQSKDGFEGEDFYNFPEGQLTNKHNLGKFKQRYGNPQVGMEVNIDYDDDGNPSIII